MTARAGYVRLEDETYEALIVEDGLSGDSIEFQRSLQFTPQDPAETRTYCIVRGGAATVYGGLLSWSLGLQNLSLRSEPAAAEVLELPPEFTLLLDDSSHDVIRGHMASIVGMGGVD